MNILIVENLETKVELITNVLSRRFKSNLIFEVARSLQDVKLKLSQEQNYDLIVANTDLAEGSSIEAIHSTPTRSPIIFISEKLDYVLKALKLNCIDYLLQPLDQKALINAFDKYLKTLSTNNQQDIKLESKYKDRFLVKQGDVIQYKLTNEIAYFYAEEKIVKLVTIEGRKFLINQSLDRLIIQLDPQIFYRVNRKFIASIHAIQSIKALSKSRLQLNLKPRYNEDIFISKEKSSAFKKWLDN